MPTLVWATILAHHPLLHQLRHNAVDLLAVAVPITLPGMVEKIAKVDDATLLAAKNERFRVAVLRTHRVPNLPQLSVDREPPLGLGLEPAFQRQPLGADGDGLLKQDEAIVDVLPLEALAPWAGL